MNTYGRFPLALAKGKGCWVKDTQGRRYQDAVAGIATCTLGHSDRAMQRALRKQLGRLQHVSNLYRIPEQEELASWLVRNSWGTFWGEGGWARVFRGNNTAAIEESCSWATPLIPN